MRIRAGGPVGTVTRNSVKGIGDREYARVQMYRVAAQPGWVAGAVVFLMMLSDDVLRPRNEVYSIDNRQPVPDMISHLRPFLIGERAVLEQDGIRDSYLAYIMQQCALFQCQQVSVIQA